MHPDTLSTLSHNSIGHGVVGVNMVAIGCSSQQIQSLKSSSCLVVLSSSSSNEILLSSSSSCVLLSVLAFFRRHECLSQTALYF